jgi:trk system potassium uptake protein TrkH
LFVNLTVAGLIVCGGIGFPVLLDIQRTRGLPWSDRWDRLHIHSKVMLLGTAALLALGMLAALVLEWEGALKGMPLGERLLVSGFHSVTCRTAGFNTIDVASLSDAMLLISIVLMMIGAGPCSTAGGFKVSTVMVLVLHAWNAFLGRTHTNLYRRTIPRETVERATATAMLFGVAAVAALTTLLVCEQSASASDEEQDLFLDASFEVASALGTVGLSTGMTPRLTPAGRLVIIALMFLGRLGPISVFVALSRSERREAVEYPGEEPMIG